MKDCIDLYADSDWQTAIEYSSDTKKKVLHDADDLKIILLKLPPGFSMAPHSHLMNEQHVILKGEYESEDRVYREGIYRSFKPHQRHGPFISKNGAMILIIWKA
ncbi:MAG: cupin domain-containing protein [Bacteroidota bacterium]